MFKRKWHEVPCMKEGVAIFDGLARMDLTIWLDVYTLFFLC